MGIEYPIVEIGDLCVLKLKSCPKDKTVSLSITPIYKFLVHLFTAVPTIYMITIVVIVLVVCIEFCMVAGAVVASGKSDRDK